MVGEAGFCRACKKTEVCHTRDETRESDEIPLKNEGEITCYLSARAPETEDINKKSSL
jgi:hypothetical protein